MCLTAELDHPQWEFTRPVWSADGRFILAVFRHHASYPVFRISPDRTAPPKIVIGGERTITGLSVAAGDGRIAFTATIPVMPVEVFVCDADGANERQLTNLNGPWKEEVRVSRPERFTFTRAGFDIDGWVMTPPGADPARRGPALLWIHGGPHREFGYYYSHEFQIYAGAGYTVVYANPRGSQGYGEAFSRAVVGDWGRGDFADIMLGLHTHFSTSDIGHIWNVGESGGVLPWENPQWYVEHSPLTHVQNVRTPLLIIHAENDLRCPVEQGEQLFVALKKLHRDVTFVRFPDESHTFSGTGKPRHRLERQRLILDWFARYLTPRGEGSNTRPLA